MTDACVVLGYINPEGSLGGLPLDPDRAWRAVESVGSHLGLATPAAASGIVELANAAMVRAIRTVSVYRGHDVRRCSLIAYGGAGPIHAGRLAQVLEMPRVLVPSYSSAFSAYGCLVADLRYDAARTVRVRLRDAARDLWEAVFRQMEVELLTQLEREGASAAQALLRRSMDLRYEGQNYEIEVPVEPGADGEAIRRSFDEIHRRQYEYATDEPVEGVNLRVAALVTTEAPPLVGESGAAAGAGPARQRPAYHAGAGWIATPVHPRGGLAPGRQIDGPAIVEDLWSTILVSPGQRIRRDVDGRLWIEAGQT